MKSWEITDILWDALQAANERRQSAGRIDRDE